MDLGIAGRKAIVCASSRGLGRACATSLAGEGVAVTINGRDQTVLDAAAVAIREMSGSEVTAVAAATLAVRQLSVPTRTIIKTIRCSMKCRS